MKILQLNLNHSWAVLDLARQLSREMVADLCAFSEPPPFRVSSANWHFSVNGSAAIYVNSRISCRTVHRSQNLVLVSVEDFYIASCYISPNSSLDEFSRFIGELDDVIFRSRGRIVICGDFNAKSHLWGSVRSNRRGEVLAHWASSVDLRLVNVGNVATCVRQQGSSVVDLTWASSALIDRVVDWRVLLNVETLSDHRCILFTIEES